MIYVQGVSREVLVSNTDFGIYPIETWCKKYPTEIKIVVLAWAIMENVP